MSGADAVALVDRYLQFCEDRDLESARSLWGVVPMRIELPGPLLFGSLEDLVAASRSQYAWVRKHRDEFAASEGPDAVTVTSIGRLYGENLHGVTFEDVRYVDVFTVTDGAITAQRVWNDLIASGVLDARR